MKAVLDTSFYCLCDLGNGDAISLLESASSIWLPVVAYGELFYGFKYGRNLSANLKRLSRFIEDFNVTMINVTSDVAQRYGEIFSSLRKKGKPIPTNDIWIAASAMEVGGTILTTDRHFQVVEQVTVEIVLG